MIEGIKRLGLDYAISKIEYAKYILPLCHHIFTNLQTTNTVMVKIEVHTPLQGILFIHYEFFWDC